LVAAVETPVGTEVQVVVAITVRQRLGLQLKEIPAGQPVMEMRAGLGC